MSLPYSNTKIPVMWCLENFAHLSGEIIALTLQQKKYGIRVLLVYNITENCKLTQENRK